MTVRSFSPPVSALGTQIQPLDFTGGFTATMHVFANDGMDGDFTVSGISTTAEDNSAPFSWGRSTKHDIIGVNFFVDLDNPIFPEAGNLATTRWTSAGPSPLPSLAPQRACSCCSVGPVAAAAKPPRSVNSTGVHGKELAGP